ncbi:MAG TPA: T9SS type A sorting domain-containing protein, partial [Cytophagales bacterium]|nr:T9SS type A sorting domain-containing protein [Cytophagales bacterium]
DECGRLVSMPKNMLNMDMEAVSFSKQDCSQDLVYSFDYQKDNAPYRCKPTYYTLVGPNGNILAKQTNNSSFTGYAPGKGYKIIREDCCRKDSLIFEWSQQLPLSIVYSKIAKQSSCKEGTTDINIRTNYPFIGDLIIASGPPSVTFRDGTVHPYVYPDTIKKVAFNATSFVSINYFTEGTYQLYVVDNCGRKAGTTVTILPSDLRRTTLVSAYEQGCENSHSIKWQVKSNFYGGEVTIQQVPEYQKKINTLEAVDSVMNLRSGAYMVNYKYTAVSPVDVYLRNMRSVACDVIVDTLDIPAYLQPAFKAPVITVCGKNLTVTLLPDSSRGIWPYQYQITSTPNSTPLQKSNVFPNLSKGTYTFLMSDACGNSYSQNTSVDTLVFPSLNVSGKTCAGQSVTLAAALYPFYSYKWVRPNGKTSSGHALTINPLTAADTGMYKVTVTPNIFGCTQSKSQQVRVNFCKVLPISFINFDANFNGTVVLLQWQVAYDEEAKYYIIEKSTDGRSFRSLSRIEASGLGTYEGTDFSYEQGLNYYRIKVVHHDGTEDHSRTVAVHTDGEELLTLSPNPADAAVYVKWASSILGGKLEILDVSGKVLIQHTVDPEVGQTVIDVEALAPGMYLLKFDQNGEVQFKKFMKQ